MIKKLRNRLLLPIDLLNERKRNNIKRYETSIPSGLLEWDGKYAV